MSEHPTPMVIKLMPDWGAGPLWVASEGGIYDPYDADEVADIVNLSTGLRGDITAWDERFQATLNEDDPANSRFPSPDAEQRFVDDGRALARRIRAELPATVSVEYATVDGKTWPVTEGQ